MFSVEEPWMRLPKPKRAHPPEIYRAIMRECGDSSIRLAQHLQSCGWTLAAAGWAAANWDLPTLAAALANERASRNIRPTMLPEAEVAKLRAEMEAAAAKKATGNLRPRKTNRIPRTTPRIDTPRLPKQPEEPGA